jgi:rRNA-processing protein FCF1
MKRIIIDTNAWLAIMTQNLDLLFAIDNACDFEYELFILEGTIDELEKIQKDKKCKGKDKSAASLALAIIHQKEDEEILTILPSTKSSDEHVDNELVKESKDGSIILTQDKDLKKRLTKPYLTIRQKKYVVLVK